MIKVAYFHGSTGEVHSLLTGPSLGGMPAAVPGDFAVLTDYAGQLPAMWTGSEVLAIPDRPSQVHTWDWPTKTWVLTLEAAKVAKWATVKATRDAREFGPFTWDDHVFDGDREAQRRLNLAILAAQAALVAGAPWSIEWTLADNSAVALSAADMVGVVQALGANIDAAHEDARAKRLLIEAAATLEELAAI